LLTLRTLLKVLVDVVAVFLGKFVVRNKTGVAPGKDVFPALS